MSFAKFPTIDYNALLSTLNDEEKSMLPFIFHVKTGQLRKSKVKFNCKLRTRDKYTTDLGNTFYIWRYPTEIDRTKANAAYVWRMIAFYCVNAKPYNCLPMGATFDLDGTNDEQATTKEKLDIFVDKILSCIPHTEWHSANRWASAFGII